MRSPSSPAHQPQALFPVSGRCLCLNTGPGPACRCGFDWPRLPVSPSLLIHKVWAVNTCCPVNKMKSHMWEALPSLHPGLQLSRSPHELALTLFYLDRNLRAREGKQAAQCHTAN